MWTDNGFKQITQLFMQKLHDRCIVRLFQRTGGGGGSHYFKGGGGGGGCITLCQGEGTHQIVMSIWPPVVGCLL